MFVRDSLLNDSSFLFDGCSTFFDHGGECSVESLGIEVIWEETERLEVYFDFFQSGSTGNRPVAVLFLELADRVVYYLHLG